MEIELKYRIPDGETAERIWEDRLFNDMEEEGSREDLDLLAKYYDTAERDLAENGRRVGTAQRRPAASAL